MIVVDDRGVVYNVEIQTCSSDNLPKRIRYYHDVLDLNLLRKGADYETLNKTYVIFVCTFDFFKKDRYVYTFKRQCQEDPEIYLADEATTVILNARGKIGEVGEELKNALRYISGQAPKGRYANALDSAVNNVKKSNKWRAGYMNLELTIRGYEIAAEKRGEKRGNLIRAVSVARALGDNINDELRKNGLGVSKATLKKIFELIRLHPDWSDKDVAVAILGQ